MEEFFTRKKANEGIKLPLHTPEGEKTEHWIRVLGVDSDEYHDAMVKAKRNLVVIETVAKSKGSDDEKQKYLIDAQREGEIKILASLISDWTFEQECTFENRVEFLTEAPQIADMINSIAGDRRIFFSSGRDD